MLNVICIHWLYSSSYLFGFIQFLSSLKLVTVRCRSTYIPSEIWDMWCDVCVCVLWCIHTYTPPSAVYTWLCVWVCVDRSVCPWPWVSLLLCLVCFYFVKHFHVHFHVWIVNAGLCICHLDTFWLHNAVFLCESWRLCTDKKIIQLVILQVVH